VYLQNQTEILDEGPLTESFSKAQARKGTMAYAILEAHNMSDDPDKLQLRFDCLTSHDITYVNIIQTARASGMTRFPLPYALTNCHNSLCAVGGTINEDDHIFGLSASKKYGGIYVPAHMAVIHQYMREMMSGCGKMILGSDSHTRYGALGTMAIGEGGGELVKQLLKKTYDLDMPKIVGVHLKGKPKDGVGPQDISLAIIKSVFSSGFVKNKVMEFVGEGIKNLNVEYRNCIDAMTTETTCLSSIWIADGQVKDYYEAHGRVSSYTDLHPENLAYYDSFIEVDLDAAEPMIAMPFHPSNVYSIKELNENLEDIVRIVEENGSKQTGRPFVLRDKIRSGKLWAQQGIIAGCAGGTFDNLCDAADILRGKSTGNGEFTLSAYPASQPTFLELIRNGVAADLMAAGVSMRSAFCGPCFGAGDVPSNNSLSVRHTTRNFPSREGAKPSGGQLASVALMDARSVAATALNEGAITAATELEISFSKPPYRFDKSVYEKRVYYGFKSPNPEESIRLGPNIKDWPQFHPLPKDILLRVASFITDPVTTTDELIPSGDTASYRSNPIALSEFTLSRKDPGYVARAKAVRDMELARRQGKRPSELDEEYKRVYDVIGSGFSELDIGIGSLIYAVKPGDGSAREQAASCQRVLGGCANIASEYATKRYRSNLANWGLLPFIYDDAPLFELGDFIFIPSIKQAVEVRNGSVLAFVVKKQLEIIMLGLADLSEEESKIILSGCLMNYYQSNA
jgi:aconitate hydratase